MPSLPPGVIAMIESGMNLFCEWNLKFRLLSTKTLPSVLSWCRILDLMHGLEQKQVWELVLSLKTRGSFLYVQIGTQHSNSHHRSALHLHPCWSDTESHRLGSPTRWESCLYLYGVTLQVINLSGFQIYLWNGATIIFLT